MRTALLLILGGLASAAEIPDVVARADADFLSGRLEEAAKGYRYLSALGVDSPDAEVNQAILARDLGRHDEALALWTKVSLLEGADGFVWNQRGWAYLALDRTAEAKESFTKAVDRSSSTADMAEAKLGLGITALQDARPKSAMAPLRDALVEGPYMIPAAAYQTGLTAQAMGDKQAALAYLRQSFDVDPLNLEALKALSRLEEKTGQNEAAWRGWRAVLSLDPADAAAQKSLKKISRWVPADLQSFQPVRRLARPILDPDGKNSPGVPRSSETIRVALFSGSDGRPATALRLYFVCNSPFQLIAANGEVVNSGKALDQWEIVFRPENNVVDVRDNGRIIQYTAKQPFRISPSSRFGSVLLKSAEFVEPYGFDSGDRELHGAIEVIPTPYGFKLVNESNLEDYLFGATGAALPLNSPAEAYRAQAVVSRTRALWSKSRRQENPERTNTCDSDYCQRFAGLSREAMSASRAVLETEGIVLKLGGTIVDVPQHENSGGVTEGSATMASVKDGPGAAPYKDSPSALERWLHEAPERDLYCEASSLVPAAESRWVRILDGEDLKERAERIKFIGNVVHLKVLSRSATGRILALSVEGSRDQILLRGQKAVMDFLSPRSLRSTLLAIQPLMKNGRAERFILWGAGTGDGLGMSDAGAIGQAELGRNWRQILAHYYPAFTLDWAYAKPVTTRAARAQAPHGKNRPKNPRKKKS